MSPHGLLEVAEHLVSAAEEGSLAPEESMRTAIGRYYFAAFLAARDFVDATTAQTAPSGPEIHGWVPLQFGGVDPLHLHVQAGLRALRELRNGADYGEFMPQLGVEVKRARKAAANVLKAIKTLRVRSTLPPI